MEVVMFDSFERWWQQAELCCKTDHARNIARIAWEAGVRSAEESNCKTVSTMGAHCGVMCGDCGAGPLLFSCRQYGDNLCHPCAHSRLATLRRLLASA
jgi:hypothetical protein